MTKDTNFKFGIRARTESPDMTPENFFEKGAWPRSRDPVDCMALSANSHKMVGLYGLFNFKFNLAGMLPWTVSVPMKHV